MLENRTRQISRVRVFHLGPVLFFFSFKSFFLTKDENIEEQNEAISLLETERTQCQKYKCRNVTNVHKFL